MDLLVLLPILVLVRKRRTKPHIDIDVQLIRRGRAERLFASSVPILTRFYLRKSLPKAGGPVQNNRQRFRNFALRRQVRIKAQAVGGNIVSCGQ
jgi:hypothetical protein